MFSLDPSGQKGIFIYRNAAAALIAQEVAKCSQWTLQDRDELLNQSVNSLMNSWAFSVITPGPELGRPHKPVNHHSYRATTVPLPVLICAD